MWLLFVAGQAGSGSDVVGHVSVTVGPTAGWNMSSQLFHHQTNMVGDVFVDHALCAALVGYRIIDRSSMNPLAYKDDALETHAASR